MSRCPGLSGLIFADAHPDQNTPLFLRNLCIKGNKILPGRGNLPKLLVSHRMESAIFPFSETEDNKDVMFSLLFQLNVLQP
jgi:hypothetical protein